MDFTAPSLLLATAALCLILQPSSALKCWQNSEDAVWSIQECDLEKNETACLGQYRLYNGEKLPSFFGCHTPKMGCDFCCRPTEGQDNDFSCCCSADLCNKLEPPRPHCPPPPRHIDWEIALPNSSGLCAVKGCSQHCIENHGKAECYCDGGYTLSADCITCVDLDECAYNNGGCEGECHNHNGTGHTCSCGDNQILKDGYRCEDYDGLICVHQRCNGTHCSPQGRDYCEPNSVCQATYKYNKTSGYQVRLLSCFSGNFFCTNDGCTLRNFSSNIYYCCCNGNLCNRNITFP